MRTGWLTSFLFVLLAAAPALVAAWMWQAPDAAPAEAVQPAPAPVAQAEPMPPNPAPAPATPEPQPAPTPTPPAPEPAMPPVEPVPEPESPGGTAPVAQPEPVEPQAVPSTSPQQTPSPTGPDAQALLEQYRRARGENRWGEAMRRLEEYGQASGGLPPDLQTDLEHMATILAELRAGSAAQIEHAREALHDNRTDEAIRAFRGWKMNFPEDPNLAALEEEFRAGVAGEEVRVPAGEALLGSDERTNEMPRRTVYIRTFWIERNLVTNAQYYLFTEVTGHRRSAYWEIHGTPFPPEFKEHPVVGISARDADAYAAWIGRRLPSAEEWEKAARWTDGRAYPWGNDFAPGGEIRCNSTEYSQTRHSWTTMPVGSFPNGASPYGVLDMAGNVWEWTGTETPGEEPGRAFRILKGGGYETPRESVRCAACLVDDADLVNLTTGFRCARDARPGE